MEHVFSYLPQSHVPESEIDRRIGSRKRRLSSSTEVSPCPTPTTPLSGTPAPKYGTPVPNRIFVGGIVAHTSEAELKSFFSAYGPVKDTKIITDRAGISKGYGFVTFETQEDAEKIIRKEADNLIFKDRKLNIGPAIRKQQAMGRTYADMALSPGSLLFTNGVPYTYQNGMAIFQSPDGGYTVPQPQPSYSTVMLPQSQAVYLTQQYPSLYNQPAAAPQWAAVAAAASQWRWAPQSPTPAMTGSPGGYIYPTLHAPELMYAQPPPHAYQPADITEAALLDAAACEVSLLSMGQQAGIDNRADRSRETYTANSSSVSSPAQHIPSMTLTHSGNNNNSSPSISINNSNNNNSPSNMSSLFSMGGQIVRPSSAPASTCMIPVHGMPYSAQPYNQGFYSHQYSQQQQQQQQEQQQQPLSFVNQRSNNTRHCTSNHENDSNNNNFVRAMARLTSSSDSNIPANTGSSNNNNNSNTVGNLLSTGDTPPYSSYVPATAAAFHHHSHYHHPYNAPGTVFRRPTTAHSSISAASGVTCLGNATSPSPGTVFLSPQSANTCNLQYQSHQQIFAYPPNEVSSANRMFTQPMSGINPQNYGAMLYQQQQQLPFKIMVRPPESGDGIGDTLPVTSLTPPTTPIGPREEDLEIVQLE